MHRSGSQGFHRFVLAMLAGLVVLATASSALAQSRSLVILGLRAPDGDDEAAANATTALRRAARNAGYEVPNDSPALEQSMASFGCDDSLPPTCLTQIANDLHAQRLVYGAVHRRGRGRDAVLTIEVAHFDVATQNTTGRDQVEVPRAMGHDSDSLSQSATRLIGTVAPAPAAENAPPPVASPPPVVTPVSRPAPVRRYVSYAAIGVGAAALITGITFGVLYALAANDPTWANYQPPGVDNNSGAAVCAYAATDTSATGMRINSYHCPIGVTYSGVGWGVGAVGAALLATGVILLVTDHPAAEQPAGDRARNRRMPPRFGFAPTITPGYQGATVSLAF